MNLPDYAQYAIVLIFVLGLIFLLTWGLRQFTGMGGAGQARFSRRQRRLSITEGASLGGRHRLILVQRDHVEHLLLIGGATDVVIETGITAQRMTQSVPAPSYASSEEDDDHIEPSFSTEPAETSRNGELEKSKALLDRLAKRKDET